MDKVRTRAVAGEDLDEILKDAYKNLNIQATPPPVTVKAIRRNEVQGDEAKALDLKPGEVSGVLDSLASFAIIKLESKDTMALTNARKEIETALLRERSQKQVAEITKQMSAQFNLQYFGMESQPDVFNPAATTPSLKTTTPWQRGSRPAPVPGQ